jgi:asparagine synthase (glutamine-hydrolysing)
MPSIVGIINAGPREKSLADLKLMHSSVLDETSYSHGTYVDESLGVYVGWATHPTSFSDCMPIYNQTNDIVMFFLGENFGVDSSIENLKAKGYKVDKTNARYLVHLYEEMGEQFLTELNGIFSGLIVDLKKNKILLFIDRYGLQRIYIHESPGSLLFASKARAITEIKSKCRQLDYRSLGEFFSCRCVLENRSLFENIRILPGGSAWSILPSGKIEKHYYFTPDRWENQEPLDQEGFFSELKDLFPKIVKKYLNKQDKAMLSATGGLDTRMILAAMELSPGRLPCYTHGGMYNESFDVKIARNIARICHQPHQVIEVGNKYLSEFHNLARETVQITDGNLDVIQSVGLYTNRIIKKLTNIRLTGNYGSEILRNHVMFKHSMPHSPLFDPEFFKKIKAAKQTYFAQRQTHPVTFIAFKQVPWYHYNRFALEQSQITQRSPYLDNQLVKLVYRAPLDSLRSAESQLRFIDEMHSSLGQIRTDRGVHKNDGKLKSLCTHAYYEFLFKMDYYFNYGMPKWIAKPYSFFAFLHMERIFLGRHKYNHFRIWFQDQLADYVKEILLDPGSASRPYLNGTNLESIVMGHLSGSHNYTNEIGMLLTIEMLHRCFIDR